MREGTEHQKRFGQLWQQGFLGPSAASNSPIGCKCGNISIFRFHVLHNTIKVEITDPAHSNMKVPTNNIAKHNVTSHQRTWLTLSLNTLKGSVPYCGISHLGPSALFKGTHISAKQCMNLRSVNFLKHANALFFIKTHPDTRITMLLTGIHHSCWLGNVGAKV